MTLLAPWRALLQKGIAESFAVGRGMAVVGKISRALHFRQINHLVKEGSPTVLPEPLWGACFSVAGYGTLGGSWRLSSVTLDPDQRSC